MKTLTLATLFCDHMVIQREKPVPVWGWCEPGETVTVALAGHKATAVAGADGAWRVTLPEQTVGEPLELSVTVGRERKVITDVLVGEVWVGSGQSNMEWPLNLSRDAAAEMAAANYPGIRLFTVPKRPSLKREPETVGAWSLCTPESAGPFSAVAYFFGRDLHQQLNVPVGLINCSWGGTVAEAWTSRESLAAEPQLKYFVDQIDSLALDDASIARMRQEYQEAFDRINIRAQDVSPGNVGVGRGWADPAHADQDWPEIPAPQPWQSAGLNHSGVIWFRKEVEIPLAWEGRALTLGIGACDKSDTTYFNGVRLGGLSILERPDAWCTPRVYTIPGDQVKAGRSVIAVRILSHIYHGGLIVAAERMRIAPADSKTPAVDGISLVGTWRYQVEQNFGLVQPPALPPGPDNPNTPTVLFNGMIAPILPYAMRGAIWYQGESNASRAKEYETLFPTMIRDWRQHWGLGDFPFLFVQLANYMARNAEPVGSQWADLRNAQLKTLDLPQTGMAVIIDIGESDDIHPRNKQDVGYRLAQLALNGTYGRNDVVPCGPLFAEAQLEGAALRLRFAYAGGGLVCRGEKLVGFAVAGAHGRWVWADARIDGETVVLTSTIIKDPTAVRYAWGDNPAGNLYNRAGLPASPFCWE